MAIPSWAVEALVRGVGTVVDKVPPERIEQIRVKAGQLLDEIPQTAARGVDSVMRGVRVGKDLVQRWAKRHTSLVTPAINGSGVLAHDRLRGVPQGAEAVELASDALLSPPLATPATQKRLNQRLNHCLAIDGAGVLVASSLNAACLAVAAAHADRPLVMHRSQSLRLPDGTPIPDAFRVPGAAAGHRGISEVGSIDQVAAGDRDSLPSGALLLSVDHGGGGADWFAGHPSTDAVTVSLMLAAAGLKPATDAQPGWGDAFQPPLLAAGDRLVANQPGASQNIAGQPSDSVDLVIVSGAGVLGGPACGLIVGKQTVLDGIARSAIWKACQADWITTALMTQALEVLASGDVERHPALSLVLTSAENLQNRGERLVTRLTAEESIAACELVTSTARLTESGKWQLPSRRLRLQHRTWAAGPWAERLLEGFPAVLATTSGETLEIDLRWIPPSDDAVLVAAILGEALPE